MNSRGLIVMLALALALALTASSLPAQARPKLAEYFTELPVASLDARYVGGWMVRSATEDLDGDGHQDLLILGWEHPASGSTEWAPRPGRVFLGDGNGRFAAAPAALFPVDTLQTIGCYPQFADFNADNRKDMFLACGGWDVFQSPGEQNRLYLSLPEGGWRDATDTLPQVSDRTTTAAVGDLSARGLVDIFVGNGNQGLIRILSYTLLNTGSGQFTQTSTNVPGAGQLLDPFTTGNFNQAALADLNDDGRPELIAAGRPGGKPRDTILWNRDGVFVQADITTLPAPARFPNGYGALNFERIDVNQDGLMDLVSVGTQFPLSIDGWYLQVFINHGNREFVDETADRVPPGEAAGGTEGVNAGIVGPGSDCLQVLDFNQDGAPDFFVGFHPSNGVARITPDQPLLWLNDGTGHFSTLKVRDFVAAGKERQSPNNVLGTCRLVPTRNGYSFISVGYNGKIGNPLTVTGLLATRPYRMTAASSASRK